VDAAASGNWVSLGHLEPLRSGHRQYIRASAGSNPSKHWAT
jgi:hypothetical protein